jgi:glycosyltransferase involved in cell wall biosynthesis
MKLFWNRKELIPPIGIGITTLNRRKMATKTLKKMRKYTPAGVPIVVVDDGSDIPFPAADHRNETPQGVAQAKNHCLRLIMQHPEVKHVFLFDDDCYPTTRDWWKQYVDSGQHHLAYLHQNMNPATHNVIYDDGKIFATERGTGCMLYFTTEAINKIGGFREEFGRWSFEHDDISHRAMNAGLIDFPYQGLCSQSGIWNLDEHQHGKSSMSLAERNPLRHRNKLLFEKYRWSSDYVPYT